MDEHTVLRDPEALLTDLGQHPHPVSEFDGVAADVDRSAVVPQACGAFDERHLVAMCDSAPESGHTRHT